MNSTNSAVRAIFFDVGNTLVLPNLERTLAPLCQRGLQHTSEQLKAAERSARRELDRGKHNGIKSTDQKYWDRYYSHLLRDLGVEDERLKQELIARARTSANWDVVQPGTRELLRQLREKYRLGIISNSDGRVASLLERCGIAECFLSFTDSGSVGVEKPHPAIFQKAMESLQVGPGESVYVGDIYSVDYVGARKAGMGAVLFDPAGTYRDVQVARVERLEELPKLLPQSRE